MTCYEAIDNVIQDGLSTISAYSFLFLLLKSVRELNGPDELIYTMSIDEVDGVSCVQKFKRIA